MKKPSTRTFRLNSLRQKILLIIITPLLLATLITTLTHIRQIQKRSKSEIESFRKTEMASAEKKLRSIVDLAYTLIDAHPADSSLNSIFDAIRNMRYDGGNGYFWIIDDSQPYPNLLFHATHPGNEGQSTNDKKYISLS